MNSETRSRFQQDYIDLHAVLSTSEEKLDFVFPGLLAETVGVLLSPGGTGKSILALELATTIAAGRDAWGLAGADPTQGSVIFLSLEDPQIVLRERVRALEASRPGMIREAQDRLRIRTCHGTGFELATWEERRLRASEHCELLKRELGALDRPRLLVIDTLNRALAGLPENDNSVLSKVISQIEQLISGTGAAALVLHHTSKSAAREGQSDTAHSARGAGAISDNARFVMNLKPLRPATAAPACEPTEHVRLIVSKCNYAAHPPELLLCRSRTGVLEATRLAAVPAPRSIRRRASPR